jgi:hypothetical protein
MGVKIDPLDDSFKNKDASLWYGERVLLKFENSRTPLIKSNKEVRKLINHQLLSKDALEKLNSFQVLIKRTEEGKSKSVELVSLAEDFELDTEERVSRLGEAFAKIKERILEASNGLKNLNDQFKANVSEPHMLVFCGHCSAFLGEEGDPAGPIQVCRICETALSKGERVGVYYPESEVSKYLEGYWFEDYVAKFLENSGWTVRTGILVMGTSGVSHEVDILASKANFILVGECKTERVVAREGIFNFVTKASDIGGSIMPLFSLSRVGDEEGREFLRKKPGFKLVDDLSSIGDSGLSDAIKNVGRFDVI